MGANTKIEWTDHSWSPWRGCTKVSPGCLNCYAETLAKRNPAVLGQWGKGAPRVQAKNWDEPVGWNRKAAQRFTEWSNRWYGTMRSMFKPHSVPHAPPRPRVFPSLCDWLDNEVPVEWLARFLTLIWETPSVDWLLLTKRPENWGKRLRSAHCATTGPIRIALAEWLDGTPPANVWFGVSVEDQTRANERIPLLLEIPAALRWLSVEPLLGPVDLSEWASISIQHHPDGSETTIPKPIEWVVVGGESGHGARPCNVEWIRAIVGDCEVCGVPVFVKQVGTFPVGRGISEVGEPYACDLKIRHPEGGDPDEWPAELRVRHFPITR